MNVNTQTYPSHSYTSNPTAEMNNELTAMLNEERHARTLANIARRAENLWEDGYAATLESTSAHFQHFTVKTPTGERYSVCLSDEPNDDVFGDYCTCPSWKKYGECKHHLALVWQCWENAQSAAIDREYEEMEEAKNFFDSRYEIDFD